MQGHRQGKDDKEEKEDKARGVILASFLFASIFIEHQLGVIETASKDLREYLDTKGQELRKLSRALGALEQRLNRHQLPLIQDALKRSGARYTIADHRKLHGVSYLTARADLEALAALGLLKKTKNGVQSVFLVPADLKRRLERER